MIRPLLLLLLASGAANAQTSNTVCRQLTNCEMVCDNGTIEAWPQSANCSFDRAPGSTVWESDNGARYNNTYGIATPEETEAAHEWLTKHGKGYKQ